MSPARLVERVLEAGPAAALVCDFDGTLTPIVQDPARSRLPAGTAEALADLAGRLAVVAIVSGRPAAFLGGQAAVPGVRLLGLYGLEEWVGGRAVRRPEAAAWAGAVDRARRLLAEALAGQDDLRLEDKGLAVAVHWRGARDEAAAGARCAALVAEVAERTGLAREPGKLVEELRPPVDRDKGSAVRDVVAGVDCSLVVYLGDDLGDVPGFAAARDLGGVAVAVDHGTETPDAVRDAADLLVDGPEGVAALLDELRRGLA